MNNPKTEEIVATLRHCATHNCIMCPAYSPPNSKCFETLAAACDRLEELEKELIDERYRHDRYADFCVAQGEELSRLKEQQRWIPVTERLPSGWVMIDADTDYRELAEYLVHVKGCEYATVAHCIDGVFTPLEQNAWFEDPVTHWRELPKPPKE